MHVLILLDLDTGPSQSICMHACIVTRLHIYIHMYTVYVAETSCIIELLLHKSMQLESYTTDPLLYVRSNESLCYYVHCM